MKNATACQRRLRFLVDSPYAASLFGFIGPQASGWHTPQSPHGSATGVFRLQENRRKVGSSTRLPRFIAGPQAAGTPVTETEVILAVRLQPRQQHVSESLVPAHYLLYRHSFCLVHSVHVYKDLNFSFSPPVVLYRRPIVFLPAGLTAGPGKEDAENTLAV